LLRPAPAERRLKEVVMQTQQMSILLHFVAPITTQGIVAKMMILKILKINMAANFNKMETIKTVSIFIFLCLAIYFGVGGLIILENDLKYEKVKQNFKDPRDTTEYSNGKITFKTEEALNAYQQQHLAYQLFPYLKNIPSFLSFFITSISFGVIGAFSKVINDIIKLKQTLAGVSNLFLVLTQGGLIGIIVLGISYLIPKILISEAIILNPITIVLLSLLGGVFYLDFFSWLESLIKKNIYKNDI
jgi:hypothetical protein